MTDADIFVVDDNPRNLALLSEVLKGAGYRVRAATDGELALNMVRALAPDLILLDVLMPGLDGYEVCRLVKADPALKDIPVIFISALDDVFDKVKAFRAGAVDYVTKPFQAEEVLARVESQVALFKLRKDLAARNEDLARKTIELTEATEELTRSNEAFARANRELVRKNQELLQSRKRNELLFSALTEVLPGQVLDGKYRLGTKIGAGGFGAVYKAEHIGLEREVAVKVLHLGPGDSSPEAVERFRLEGVSACRVNHPSAVSVLDFGLSSGTVYLVMELLEGRSLAEELDEKKRLPPARCIEIITPVCRALSVAHSAGIVHRDIKPENIFLHHPRTGGEVVKVLDFGIAKLRDDAHPEDADNLTAEGELLGTLIYMAPERIDDKDYDGRADVYSVGVMLYEMLSGDWPFGSRDTGFMALMMKIMADMPTPLRAKQLSAPEELADVVMRALARDPAARPSADEFADRLEAVKQC